MDCLDELECTMLEFQSPPIDPNIPTLFPPNGVLEAKPKAIVA